MSHTKGPWHVDYALHKDPGKIMPEIFAGNIRIAKICRIPKSPPQTFADSNERVANANMMAASTDLFRELKNLLRHFEDYYGPNVEMSEAWIGANNALKKAEAEK